MAHAYREVHPHRGQMREFLQAGIELIGSSAPEGTAEALSVLARALDARFLAAHGFDVVRVGFNWSGLEPQPGVFDSAYLGSIVRTVRQLGAHRIWSVLDWLANWPDLRFTGRSLYVGADFVVQEWTAYATHRSGKELTWEGVDVFPFKDGKILRKDVYSNASRRVTEQLQ